LVERVLTKPDGVSEMYAVQHGDCRGAATLPQRAVSASYRGGTTVCLSPDCA
jgi:hypothetical protein